MVFEILVVVLVLAVALTIAMRRESARRRSLEAWTRARPGARLHWPFRPEEHSVPAEALVTDLLGHPPLGWAAAVECPGAEDPVWLVEYRCTPLGRKTAVWFTLVAHRARSGHGHEADAALHHWTRRSLPGLISVALLESELA